MQSRGRPCLDTFHWSAGTKVGLPSLQPFPGAQHWRLVTLCGLAGQLDLRLITDRLGRLYWLIAVNNTPGSAAATETFF
ncbi:hypothetical protein J6590_022663 [Homalodisca vitripennis]|nr:hypothetical protein J6590_022663 [Homalodisca vitripennis]